MFMGFLTLVGLYYLVPFMWDKVGIWVQLTMISMVITYVLGMRLGGFETEAGIDAYTFGGYASFCFALLFIFQNTPGIYSFLCSALPMSYGILVLYMVVFKFLSKKGK